jgi:hypothetical protein
MERGRCTDEQRAACPLALFSWRNKSPSVLEITSLRAKLTPGMVHYNTALCTLAPWYETPQTRISEVYARFVKGCSNRARIIPAKSHPILDATCPYPILHTPICQYLSCVTDGNEAVVRHVRHLFFLCRPSAVLGRIVTVAVNPVYGVPFRRFLPHIRKKIGKAIFSYPAISNLDTASTIQVVPMIMFLRTAFNHGAPRIILGMVNRITSMGVTGVILPLNSALKTTSPRVSLEYPRRASKYISTFALNDVVYTADLQNGEFTLMDAIHRISISQRRVLWQSAAL